MVSASPVPEGQGHDPRERISVTLRRNWVSLRSQWADSIGSSIVLLGDMDALSVSTGSARGSPECWSTSLDSPRKLWISNAANPPTAVTKEKIRSENHPSIIVSSAFSLGDLRYEDHRARLEKTRVYSGKKLQMLVLPGRGIGAFRPKQIKRTRPRDELAGLPWSVDPVRGHLRFHR
jgi:hypothetical protein